MTRDELRRALSPTEEEIEGLQASRATSLTDAARAATTPTVAEVARLRGRERVRRRAWGGARPLLAALTLAAVLLGVFWPSTPVFAPTGPVVTTPRPLALGPDVAVTGAASLTVLEAGPDGTVVRLVEGAARFEVDPRGRWRTLTVLAGDVSVSVTGTIFTVEVTGDQTTVRVERGAVRVETPVGPTTLGAGEAWESAPLPLESSINNFVDESTGSVPEAPEDGRDPPTPTPSSPSATSPAPTATAGALDGDAEAARAWIAVLDTRDGGASPGAVLDAVEGWLRHWPGSALAAEAGALRLALLADRDASSVVLPEVEAWLAAWPDDARRGEVLTLKATLLRETGDCEAAIPVYVEVARRSQGPLARQAAAWIKWCQQPSP